MKKCTVPVHLDFVATITVEAMNEGDAIEAAEYAIEGMAIRDMNCVGNFDSTIINR